MQKNLDFTAKESYAKSLSIVGLHYAIMDCQKCVQLKLDEAYYLDEISVYRQELEKRK